MSWIGAALLLCAAGCSDRIRTPTSEEMAAFERAGSIRPVIDMDRIERAKLKTGPYCVVPGDVLEFTMPTLLQAATAAEVQAAQRTQVVNPCLARVRDNGAIALPAVGSMMVAGLSLAQIEERVTEAYRSHVVLYPSVFVRVSEYRTAKVYIAGAVEKPGVYALPSDQMTLSSLLTQAGGIAQAGAAVVRVVRSELPRAAVAPGPAPKSGPAPDALENAVSDANERSAGPDGDVEQLFQDLEPDAARAGSPASSRPLVGSDTTQPASGDGRRREEQPMGTDERPTLSPAARAAFEAGPQASPFALGNSMTPAGVSLPTLSRPQSKRVAPAPPIRAAQPPPSAASALGNAGLKPVLLPVVNTNIPYRDIALDDGDTVVVEPVQMPLFSVLGLVAKPGNFPYPPGAQYNLTQAIAFAGGLDPVAQPYYATIYRVQADGSVARAPFRLIDKDKFTDALGTLIRPGDVVAVENTPRTRFNTVIRELFRINAGVYVTGQDLWGSNN